MPGASIRQWCCSPRMRIQSQKQGSEAAGNFGEYEGLSRAGCIEGKEPSGYRSQIGSGKGSEE